MSKLSANYRHSPNRRRRVACLVVIAAAITLASLAFLYSHAAADTGSGAVSLNSIGTPVTENLDTLSNTAASTTNTTLPTGWYLTESGGGARDNEQYAVDTGGSTTGDSYSYGAAAATDRALGGLRSGTLIPVFGAKFTNNTGVTITSLAVSYVGEEWRLGTASRTDRLDFQISTNATDLSTGTYTDVDALDFTTPDTATAGTKNGNAAADHTAIAATIVGLSIPNGSSFFIRWTDLDATSADDGLAVDDFSITPQAGPVTPTVNVNDLTQAETNAGTTTFSFTVSLTSPAGITGVTFDIATADGTAQDGSSVLEDKDYVAKSETARTITSGNASAQFTVTVNGDALVEPNETFFVNITNITGANAGDTQGLGTISNDDLALVPIHTIQGSGNASPLAANALSTSGVVTGLRTNGFYLQEPDATIDANPNTSEGIFVFTSSAPPAAATIGNFVTVSGTVQEFTPTADPSSQPLTEIITPTLTAVSSGNPLPAAVTLTAANTGGAGETNLNNLEEFEGMRVQVNSLIVCGPTQGSIAEPAATVSSTGVFFGVITGVPRPFREAGIPVSDPVPAPNPANVPRFDENPERIRVDSDAQPGTIALDVSDGTVVTNLVGELDYALRAYTIVPEAGTPPGIGAQPGSLAVPAPTVDEFTVASFNMERFFDTADEPGISDPVLTGAAFNRRLAKASLIIRAIDRYPDAIGVEEVENLATLQAVAAQTNSDAVNVDGLPNPNYTAYLMEGNDVGGIDVGFLVKQSRITVIDVTQLGKATTYLEPGGATAFLNDRPPLVLRATVPRTAGGTLPFTVVVNHLRSLSAIDDPVDGARVREKRRQQAEFLANLIQTRQVADPNEKIITVGDMNALRVNDGYVDVIGTILGTPTTTDQVVAPSLDLVNPNQTDLVDTLPAAQQYSYNFDGNAQTLDHIIVSPPALAILSRFAYARNDSDFAVKNYESTNELRLSDHDQPVAYFSLLAPTAANGVITGRITDANGAPVAGAVVSLSGTQNRKFITDANGFYRFDNVETTGFYTVTPSRANYTFSPTAQSFSQLGETTSAGFGAIVACTNLVNPLDTPEYYVRQHYLDFLGREPDEAGFNFWSDQILECGADQTCIERRRENVSAAYFLSIEFQQTGGPVDGLYRASYGAPPSFAQFLPDSRMVGNGVVVGRDGWEAKLAANKDAFVAAFVNRLAFHAAYDGMNNTLFVATLIGHTGVSFTTAERDALVSRLDSGGTRAEVVRSIAEDQRFVDRKFNEAFVMMEYFGYLRRDPDASGFAFWLNKLNEFNGNFEQAELVKAFIDSGEYRDRFPR